jgi:hypothetical protein
VWAEDGHTPASPGVSDRVASLRRYDCWSSRALAWRRLTRDGRLAVDVDTDGRDHNDTYRRLPGAGALGRGDARAARDVLATIPPAIVVMCSAEFCIQPAIA